MDLIAETVAMTSRAIDKLVLLLAEEPRTIGTFSLVIETWALLVTREPNFHPRILGPEVRSVKNDLDYISSFLKDEDSKSEDEDLSELGKTWMKQVKEVAELIQDVVDEYTLEQSSGKLFSRLNSRQKVARKFENIKALLLQAKERGERLNFRERGSSSSSSSSSSSAAIVVERYQSHFASPFPGEFLVGIDTAEYELIKKLTEGTSRRSVISLVGFGGIGKTTLAKIVYDKVKENFEYYAWINVSRSLDIKELLRSMVKEICEKTQRDMGDIRVMKELELISILAQFLQGKRYLFVFDDVWEKEFWRVMKHALPDADKCSRIIITTRSETVGASFKESSFDHVHRLEPLSETMSWELFRRIAFRHELDLSCPPELEQLSLEFVRMCEGLPLAIVAIAGLLSTKEKTVSSWRKVVGSFYVQLKSNAHLGSVSKILALSFRDLPSEIKLCFIYFSIFPEESLIPNEKLIKLWIAEGFIQETTGEQTLEEVAEDYLNELIRRNLVQACEGFYELEKFCRVHSLMHEIVRQKADEFSFCQILRKNNSRFGRKGRRLSICDNVQNVLGTIEDSQVRSVFLFNVRAVDESFVVILFRKCKLLTLLDFENAPLEYLPYELGNLFHLKYLNLKNTKLKWLPKSVGKLRNLQTLDLRNTLLIELPIEINKLQNLRHLLASYHSKASLDSAQGVRIKEGIGRLENLQTLMTVVSSITLVQELENLQQLRRLGISRLTTAVASSLCACIKEMSYLESLNLHSMNNYELALQTISSPPPLLQRLVLKGLLQSLPCWISSLRNLNMLCLSFSKLVDDPLDAFSDLPNLVSLWLYRAYDGEQLHFKRDGFQKLKLLVVRELHGLKLMEIEEGALPCLEELRIGSSPLLNEVPSGIQHLRNLKVLANYDMPNEFVLSMQPGGGQDHCKVEHVLSVLFLYRVQGRRYMLYNLGEEDLLARVQGTATNDIEQRRIRRNHINQLSFSSDIDVDQLSFSIDLDVDQLSVSSDTDFGRLSLSSDRDLDRLSFSSDRSVVQWSNHNRLSFSRVRSIVQRTDANGSSFSSDHLSFISDDIED